MIRIRINEQVKLLLDSGPAGLHIHAGASVPPLRHVSSEVGSGWAPVHLFLPLHELIMQHTARPGFLKVQTKIVGRIITPNRGWRPVKGAVWSMASKVLESMRGRGGGGGGRAVSLQDLRAPSLRNTEMHLPSSFYTKHTTNIKGQEQEQEYITGQAFTQSLHRAHPTPAHAQCRTAHRLSAGVR